MSSEDRIEREILLKAPLSRVWRAMANAEEFGEWFGAALKGEAFIAGNRVRGQITYPGYEHLTFEVLVEELEPERKFSFRWHPYAVDPTVDYGQEPMTLVVFTMHAVEDGTLLRLVESGFDGIPAERRQEAFRMHCSGWDEQVKNIEKHVATP